MVYVSHWHHFEVFANMFVFSCKTPPPFVAVLFSSLLRSIYILTMEVLFPLVWTVSLPLTANKYLLNETNYLRNSVFFFFLRTGFSPCDIDKLLRENTLSVMDTISCLLQIQITWWKIENFWSWYQLKIIFYYYIAS